MNKKEELVKELQRICGAIIYDDDWNKLADFIVLDRKRIIEPLVKGEEKIKKHHYNWGPVEQDKVRAGAIEEAIKNAD